MRGARERRLGRRDVADVGVDADVGRLIVEPRRARLRPRPACRDHRLERLVVDDDQLGGVLGAAPMVSATTIATASPT